MFPEYAISQPSVGFYLSLFLPYILLVAIVGSIFGILTNKLAKAKGYTGYFWTGFFLYLIGLLYVIGLPLYQDNQALLRRIEKR